MIRILKNLLSITLTASIMLGSFTLSAFAQPQSINKVGVSYSAHVQDKGWMSAASNGQTAGTLGQSLRMEALQISLTNAPAGAGINYSAHVQDKGWMPVVGDGTIAGTTGQQKRLEAISISLSGLPGYSVKYRVHVQDIGWMDWQKDGSIAGTTSQSKRVEAIQITIVAPQTVTKSPVSIAAIQGVTVPVNGATPVTTITQTAQYTGSVAWTPSVGKFGSNTSYTATITLTPKTGFTLAGVAANFFTVAGSTSDTNAANSGVIKAVFPATDMTINKAAIQGVTVPAKGETPVTAITETAQYTGRVVWLPSAGMFGSNTSYTATITLIPKTGFTLKGVAANFFTVAGSTTDTNAANSGVIKAVFPATTANVNISAIQGVTVPVTGETPVTTITETAQYTGSVVWTPSVETFDSNTTYTATITLTPKTGFTLTDISANFFTVAGTTSDTNAANTGVITAVFPATDTTINIAAIQGVTVPVNDAAPETTITETEQYTGSIVWTPSVDKFGSNTSYTATITLTPKTGFTLAGIAEDFFTVARTTSYTNDANSGVITAVFPATDTTINIAAIQGVTVPVIGETPVTTITETAQYTGTVAWTPSVGTFASDTSYTAKISLTPKTGFTVRGVTEDFFTVAGTASDTNAAYSWVVTAVFPTTDTTIDIAAIQGVTVPVNGATPITTITDTAQYTGTVEWTPTADSFGSNTSYTATITLTPKTGFSLTDVEEDFFTVAGTASVTNAANSGVITAVFPATDTTINMAAIQGVTVPVNGATPVTTITETAQYTGSVAWTPSVGKFGSNISYTATITLTPKTGFSLTGVAADFYTVAGTTSDTNAANSGVITAVFPATDKTISIAAIQGVMVPVTGDAQADFITETEQYTGSIEWMPGPGWFDSNTSYTATITLTPKTGFTLTGVAADFFTVAGTTSDTNAANSGVITAVFPVTAMTIDIAVIQGVTIPVNGATPVTTITETAQYTGSVAWSPSAGAFGSNTAYTATITLTPKTGFTLEGVQDNFFTVAGTTSDTNTDDSGVITAVFPATATTINIAAIQGVTVPVNDAVPETTITETAQYTGSIVWTPSVGKFGSNTSYTATITLTPKTGFTLAGVDANFFTVAGTTSDTNPANSGVITAVFPVTDTTIDIAAIQGVTVPVIGATPVTTITETAQYTGTVEWGPTDVTFGSNTFYTAEITLMPKAGFTLAGIASNFFTVAGATSDTNAANSGIIMAIFPATDTTINIAAIQGVTVPANGATPVTAITETAQYTGTVEWNPTDDTFGLDISYTATIALTPKTGFTLTGVTADLFTVAGTTSVTNAANSGVITAVFPATDTTIDISAIQGVTVPVNGATPVTTITETAQYTGSIAWTPSVSTFGSNTIYTATITLTPKTGFTLSGIAADFFTVAGTTSDINPANSGVITAVFPATDTTINIATIQGVTVPVTGATPVTTITETAQYTGSVAWLPSVGTFGPYTSYRATITLTPKAGFTLTGVAANLFTVAGATSDTNAVNSGVITAEFPATAATINIAAIQGVTVPVTGATPVTTITQTAQYTGTVSWSPAAGSFAAATTYTATITLTAKAGFTLTGVAADFFTVAGTTSDTNAVNTGVITAAFPATEAAPTAYMLKAPLAGSWSDAGVTSGPVPGGYTIYSMDLNNSYAINTTTGAIQYRARNSSSWGDYNTDYLYGYVSPIPGGYQPLAIAGSGSTPFIMNPSTGTIMYDYGSGYYENGGQFVIDTVPLPGGYTPLGAYDLPSYDIALVITNANGDIMQRNWLADSYSSVSGKFPAIPAGYSYAGLVYEGGIIYEYIVSGS